MTIWTRAAIILSAVGLALLALAAFATAAQLRAGATAATLIPLLLGVGLKGTLALMAAAVMGYAARLEARRARLQATGRARPVAAAPPPPERLAATARRRPAEPAADDAGGELDEAAKAA